MAGVIGCSQADSTRDKAAMAARNDVRWIFIGIPVIQSDGRYGAGFERIQQVRYASLQDGAKEKTHRTVIQNNCFRLD